jgi:hypothetical protein
MNYWAVFALAEFLAAVFLWRELSRDWRNERVELKKEITGLRKRQPYSLPVPVSREEAEDERDREPPARPTSTVPRRGPRLGFSQVKKQLESQPDLSQRSVNQ